ncbi:hypothetical protein FGLOB1_2598 [Fusarium globosum]|uniref:JmjC domain-containing protein n=1 Tax=Fusarium globosum TaxID=78864 RepID=A0A8H5YPC0_9HYPO|nr:hypothetical protein FGLOB1_2598 [Fusarium globosum]
MGKLVGEGLQISFNGKLLSELATKTSRRIHWLPQDRVVMEQWLRANHTTAFLEDTSDACLEQLAFTIGLDFRRLNGDQKKVVKAKMRSSLKYTLNKLKVSGEVSERWDPQGKQVVLDWTQSAGQTLRGIHDSINNTPCPAPPTHQLAPRVWSTDDHQGQVPGTGTTLSSKQTSQMHPTVPSYFLQASPAEDDELEFAAEEFYRQKDHVDQPPPYSAQANFVEVDLERATEDFYRAKAHLDRFADLINSTYKTKDQDAIAHYTSVVPDTRRHSARQVAISVDRGQAARKESRTTGQEPASGSNYIGPERHNTSSRSLMPEMAERKSPALHESESTRTHRKFVEELQGRSHMSKTTPKMNEPAVTAVEEAACTRCDEHFQKRLLKTSIPDTVPGRRQSVQDHRALWQRARSDNKVRQRSSPSNQKPIQRQPRMVPPKELTPFEIHNSNIFFRKSSRSPPAIIADVTEFAPAASFMGLQSCRCMFPWPLEAEQASTPGLLPSWIDSSCRCFRLDLIETYRYKAEDALSRMIAMIDARKNAKTGTRESEDYKSLHKYCTGVSVGRTMSASDYMDLSQGTKPQDSIIVCTVAEATEIFIKEPPIISVLIVGTPNPRPLRIDTFLAWLTCRNTLHVHDFSRPPEEGRAPIALPSKDAKTLFETRGNVSGPALNFLNLRGTEDDAGPECIKNIHGVFTTVLNEQGEKVWFVWPNLGFDVLRNWDGDEELPTGPIAIHIEEGSYLIQPPSTLHAPVTMNTCLMTGTMHWHSGHLLDIIQVTCIINEDEKITNEDISDQFIPKMAKLLRLWRENKAPCSWPPLDQYAEAMTALDNL